MPNGVLAVFSTSVALWKIRDQWDKRKSLRKSITEKKYMIDWKSKLLGQKIATINLEFYDTAFLSVGTVSMCHINGTYCTCLFT